MVVHVLLVEDDDADFELAKRHFRKLGPEFTLDRVPSLEDALVRLRTERGYDLVLLDLGLPGTSGISAVQSVAAVDVGLPIIVLTGIDDEFIALAALREGAQDYLVKGKSNADTLIRAIRYALERGRLQADRGALEMRLAQSLRLEALGRFAGGIAHEINNRLNPIIGMSQLQLATLPEGERARDMAATILNAAEGAAKLVRELLSYARNQLAVEVVAVDMRGLVEHSAAIVCATLPPMVKLQVEVVDGAPILNGVPSSLQAVILNLLTNAVDAMEGRSGRIVLALSDVNGHEVDVPATPPLAHARYLRLTVSDDGVGMDRETLARAFDPFFTTKSVSRGTGLGLSIVHGIVLDHQGAIAVSSDPGRGTTVDVFLPVSR